MSDEIPAGAVLKDLSPLYNQATIPHRLRVFSSLDADIWGRVEVSEGEVELMFEDGRPSERLAPGKPGVIAPGVAFRFAPTGKPTVFQIRYYHPPPIQDAGELAALLARGALERGAAKA